MMRRKRGRAGICAAVVSVVAIAAAVSPLGASAATVVNGDFETGSLTGWSLFNSEDPEGFSAGSWYAYSGTVAPYEVENGLEPRSVPAPPQGTYAAITDQGGPGTHVLFQDVALEPNAGHTLSMLLYYQTDAPLFSPDSLESDGFFENQQYRVDVMRAGAPVTSVSSADVLATVFRTAPGGPQTMGATPVSVDLSPFAGQTVRLRLAEVDNLDVFNAGADAIAIASQPFNTFAFGKLRLNRKKGTAKLEVTVPNPGVVSLTDVRALARTATASAKKKRRPILVRKAQATAAAPGLVSLNVRPTRAGRKALKAKGSLAFRVQVAFTPNGGATSTQVFKGKLRLKRSAPKR